MNTNTCIKTRKSSETFLPTPLSREIVQTIVESAAYAPIFGQLHFTVVEKKELISSINEVSIEMMKHSGNEFAEKVANTPGYSAVRNAPAAVILSALNGNDIQGFNMANVCCAAENMLLSATELGIGSRFVMGPVMSLNHEPIKSALNLPEGFIPLVMVLLGNIEESLEERKKDITNISFI